MLWLKKSMENCILLHGRRVGAEMEKHRRKGFGLLELG